MEKHKTVWGLVLGFASVFVFLMLKDLILGNNGKLAILKNDILNNYYNKTILQELLKENLGDDYTDDLDSDFDNYIITTVLNDLSKYEDEKNKRYNAFLSKEFMDEYYETRKDKAESISSYQIEENIYYIDIKHFYDGITYSKINNCVEEMKKYKKIIIDLRDNTGGSFDELKKVANMFLDQGKTIYQLDYIDKKEKYTSKNRNPLVFDKIVLLINNDTASVSELFVIALDENLNNVTKIGTNTYGKKVSYSIRSFKDKSAMIFINSIMEGANLKPIDADGIKPDIEIGHTEEYYLQIEDESSREKTRSQDKELQLNEALQFLKE